MSSCPWEIVRRVFRSWFHVWFGRVAVCSGSTASGRSGIVLFLPPQNPWFTWAAPSRTPLISNLHIVRMAPAPVKTSTSLTATAMNGNGVHANGVNGYSALKRPVVDAPVPKLVQAPPRTVFALDSVEDTLAAFARGEFVAVVDDENRENEADLIMSGSVVTTQQMAWMIKHTRFVISPS